MADYRPDWDEDIRDTSHEIYQKHPANLTNDELSIVRELLDARRRLKKLDAFLGQFR